MKIAVCVKSVPDGESDRRFDGGLLVRGEDDVLNELDENAIEAAVSLVENSGGEVVAISMGPESATDGLLRALQMGADRAIHIYDERLGGADVLRTAEVLGEVITSEGGFDLVLTGMTSLDSMTSLVAPALAEFLDLPSVGSAAGLTAQSDGTLKIDRRVDGWLEEFKVSLPAVISVTDELNEPRYPSFKEMKAARTKPLVTLSLDDLSLDDLEGPSEDSDGPADGQLATLANVDQRVTVTNALKFERSAPSTLIEDDGTAGTQLAEYLASKGV